VASSKFSEAGVVREKVIFDRISTVSTARTVSKAGTVCKEGHSETSTITVKSLY
jgi:hypothetical protein